MKPQSKLQIVERQVEDMSVLVLTGEITVDDGDIAFGKYVDGLLAKGARKIVIDLAGPAGGTGSAEGSGGTAVIGPKMGSGRRSSTPKRGTAAEP